MIVFSNDAAKRRIITLKEVWGNKFIEEILENFETPRLNSAVSFGKVLKERVPTLNRYYLLNG
jgi:hypothetical protein